MFCEEIRAPCDADRFVKKSFSFRCIVYNERPGWFEEYRRGGLRSVTEKPPGFSL
jgi:hypothetical protein